MKPFGKRSVQDPFQIGGDRHVTACISSFRQFRDLAECYRQSAEALVEVCTTDRTLLDVYVCPICFLYRHALELLLKDLLWKSNFARLGKKLDLSTKHPLVGLWSRVHDNLTWLSAESAEWPVELCAKPPEFVNRLEQLDANSQGFRYPYDKNRNPTLPGLSHVNVRHLQRMANGVFDYLLTLIEPVEYLYFARGTAE